jgi:hypothetical protein
MDKREELMTTMKDLEVMDLIAKKTSAIKDLDKQVKQLTELQSSKRSERSKMGKSLDKMQDQLVLIEVIDKLLQDKDF